jgi:hypothetical protein
MPPSRRTSRFLDHQPLLEEWDDDGVPLDPRDFEASSMKGRVVVTRSE